MPNPWNNLTKIGAAAARPRPARSSYTQQEMANAHGTRDFGASASKSFSFVKMSGVKDISNLSRGAALDAFLVLGTLENRIHENAGRVHPVRRKLADVHQLFHFGDDVVGGGGHHRIEVARGLAINEVAPAVALPCFDEREVDAQAALHHVHAAVELPGLFAFGDHGAVAGGRVERGDARAAGAQAFAERALRIQLYLQLAAQDKLLEEFVFAHVGRDHLLHLALLE